MKFGLFGINMGPLSDPDASVEVAQTAEAAGFESIWAGEHVVLPDPQVVPSPLPPSLNRCSTPCTPASKSSPG